MQVILMERVAKLGQMGDVVTVKQGYARNYLLPLKKAMRATEANIKVFETQKSHMEARNLEAKSEADSVAKKLDGKQFIIIRSASDTGSLYGSVTNRDAAEAAISDGFSIDKKQIIIDKPIKELGLHTILVSLHPETQCNIALNVARSEDEAALQADGKSIQDLAAQAEADAEFEIAELFDDMGAAALEELEELTESDNKEKVEDTTEEEITES
jgi:large subunit ribosomal protein L9